MSAKSRTSTRDRAPARFEHLFVATDFSASAGHALARAGRLPLAAGGRITIAHVLPPGIPAALRPTAEKDARARLAAAAESLRELVPRRRRGPTIATQLSRGQPYVEIIRHARAAGADLVVIGRHGERPIRDMFLGSTAARVVRAGDLPLLVVSRRPAHGYRRPVLAIDLEDTSRSLAVLTERILGDEVEAAAMVHAYHVPFEGLITPGASPDGTTELRTHFRDAALRRLAKFQASLGEPGARWRTSAVRGDPRTAILAETLRRNADLLGVGTHGRSGLFHALLGSVAEWLIQAAACDVLVARPVRMSFELP